jgi:trk system potassium uptake protein TrkH
MPQAVPRPLRRLQVARLVGIAALGLLGMVVVHTPAAHFGAASEITLIGAIYGLAVVLFVALIGAGALAGRRWAAWGTSGLLALNILAFLPALLHDLPVAGGVVLWNFLLLANHLLPADAGGLRARRAETSGEEATWLRGHGDAARHLLLVSLFADLSIIGFEVASSWLADLTCLALGLGLAALTGPFMLAVVRAHPRYLAFLVVPLLVAPWSSGPVAGALIALALYQSLVLVLVVARGPLFGDLVQSFLNRPALLILGTFGAMAALGAVVLSFPAAAAGRPLSFIDALFTATSAACITGLSVLDTATAFTRFGHIVILVLVQLGGLGIMVLSTFATVLLGGRLALRSEQALEEVLDLASPRAAYELARFIVVSTLALEALGAAALTARFTQYDMPLADAAWAGVFHSVTAFCHAGFSLWSDSLIPFRHDPVILGVHMVLIVLGSLGFSVLAAMWMRARGATRRFSLQTRVVLWMTLLLTVSGTALYALLEWDATLRGLGVGEKWLSAAFQSLSLRSAGFNTVPLLPPVESGLPPVGQATIAMMMIWMFIGAAPGGTGGGIKVTTFAVVLAAIPALLRQQGRATLMRRAIPHEILYRAATIVTIAAVITGGAVILILATHDLRLDLVAFEVISAVGTVGMSLGITGKLEPVGKWVIIVLMFIGRVGPTSLALALGSPKASHVNFPEGRLMVG